MKTIRNGRYNYLNSSKHKKYESLSLDETACTSKWTNINGDDVSEHGFDIEKLDFSCIENIITDKLLFDSIKKLSNRQKEVLYYICIKGQKKMRLQRLWV